MELDFKIEGGAELDAALARIGRDIETRIAKNAIGAGARKVRDRAKQLAPVDTGNLRDAIKVRRANKRYGAAVADVVVTGGSTKLKNDAWYASLVEFGTVNSPAHPFLRPALDASQPLVLTAVADSIRKQLAKQAAARWASSPAWWRASTPTSASPPWWARAFTRTRLTRAASARRSPGS